MLDTHGSMVEIGRGLSVEYAREMAGRAAAFGMRVSVRPISALTASLWVHKRDQARFYTLRVERWLNS